MYMYLYNRDPSLYMYMKCTCVHVCVHSAEPDTIKNCGYYSGLVVAGLSFIVFSGHLHVHVHVYSVPLGLCSVLGVDCVTWLHALSSICMLL